MPRQIIATAYTGLESITEREVVPAVAEPGKVVIAMRAAGVNRSDLKSALGMFGSDESKLPLQLGNEMAGVVTSVGEGVDHVAPGDEVVAYRVSGAFADEVVAPASGGVPQAVVARVGCRRRPAARRRRPPGTWSRRPGCARATS